MDKPGVLTAAKAVFSKSSYSFLAGASTVAFAAIYLWLSNQTSGTPSFSAYVQSLPPLQLGFLAVLSIGLGLLLAMQVYSWRERGASLASKESAGAGAAAVSSIASGLFAAASCSLCLTALVSLLGAGGVLFIASHRSELMLVSLALLVVSFHYTARRINEGCIDCAVPRARRGKKKAPR